MSWLNAVNTCWPPGQQGCVVWWDAWVVVFAALALLVALASIVVTFWGVIATVISSIAVWRLGQRANSLAESGAQQVALERSAIAEAERGERTREEIIVLSYISAEMSAIYPSIAALSKQLGEPQGEEKFISSQPLRKMWADDIVELKTPRIQGVLQRLHRLPSDTGARIARILGDVQTIDGALKNVADVQLEAQPSDALREHKRYWLSTMFKVIKNSADRAADDIAHCALAATKATSSVAIVPRGPNLR